MPEETIAPDNNNNEPENVITDYLHGYQELELQSAENKVKKARNAIFAIAIIFLVSDLIIMGMSDTFTTVGLTISIAVSAVFVGLAFLTKKQPLTAILVALALFAGVWILNIIVVGPDQIYKGILVRGIILYFLITGIRHAKEAERLRRELQK